MKTKASAKRLRSNTLVGCRTTDDYVDGSAAAEALLLKKPRCFDSEVEAAEFLRERAVKRVMWKLKSKNNDMSQLCSKRNCSKVSCHSRGALVDAQNIVNKSYAESSINMRIRLAKAALKFDPNCVDAYIVLSKEEAVGFGKKEELCFQSIRAGLRLMGDATLNDPSTQFYINEKTRPWMRALFELARLYRYDNFKAAVKIWQRLLLLDAHDSLGVLQQYVPALIENDRVDDAEKLLAQYPENFSTPIIYSRVLVTYKKFGPGKLAEHELWQSLLINKHVCTIITLGTDWLSEPEQYYLPGSEDEAQVYLSNNQVTYEPASPFTRWIKNAVHERVRSFDLYCNSPDLKILN